MARVAAESCEFLHRRLSILEASVQAAVARRRSTDPDPDDRFRGLYISDSHVDQMLGAPVQGGMPALDHTLSERLARIDADAKEVERAGGEVRLGRLAQNFGLDALEVSLLLVALAPDVDPRFERLYAYLNDDVSRRRATIGLALELTDTPLASGDGRARFGMRGNLVRGGLLIIEEAERPYLTRSLRVPDRVIAHLLGDDTPDPLVAPSEIEWVDMDLGDPGPLERAILAGVGVCYVRERASAAGLTYAARALSRAGLRCVAFDLERLIQGEDVRPFAEAAAREARFAGGGLVVGPLEAIFEHGEPAVRVFAEGPCPVVIVGTKTWDPSWSREVPFLIDAPIPSSEERRQIWALTLSGRLGSDTDAAGATAHFRLTPEQIVRTARAAARHADATGNPLRPADLHAGARAQNAAGLERLARRIEPRASWDDLVVPEYVGAQLGELTSRARHRDQVLDEWGLAKGSSRGRGVTALFAGESGTGKTMSAEIVAGDLGLDLYVIDLSTIVDKYIGETEKNLERVFNEADRVNGVLLFDEADAIFGKRSEVKDAHDRYANLEIAFLLQRMERFDGLAILTTNLRSNLDEAFTRRLDSMIDFPMPEEHDRRRLWALNLARGLPLGEDLDLDFLAGAFSLSGGNIRNIVVTAAFMAAEDHTQVEMSHVIRATEREYRKLGRLRVEEEFGRYYALLV